MDFMLRNHLCAHFFTFFFGNNARGNNVSDFNMDDFSAARTLDVQITTFFPLHNLCAHTGQQANLFIIPPFVLVEQYFLVLLNLRMFFSKAKKS